MVLAHPLYLTRLFFKWLVRSGRELYVEAAYRQTKEKLFVYLSEREEKKIKNFAEHGLPITAWRMMLRLKGLKPVHTLAAAMAVTLIFAVLPRPVEAKTRPIRDPGPSYVCLQEISNHLARMSISEDDQIKDRCGTDFQQDIGKTMSWEKPTGMRQIPLVGKLMIIHSPFCLQEVIRKIEHIPLTRLFSAAFGSYRFAN